MDFFTRIPPGGNAEFELFTTPYYIASGLSLVFLVVVFLYLPRIKLSTYEKYIRTCIIIYLLFSSVYKQVYFFQYNFPWYYHLPNATCGFAIVTGVISLITKNRVMTILTLFWGWGAFMALLAPNVIEGPDKYYFYQFYIRHLLIVVAGLYWVRLGEITIYKKDYLIYVMTTTALALLGWGVSALINKPDEFNMFYMLVPAVENNILYFFYDIHPIVYSLFWIGVAALFGYLYGLPFMKKDSSKHDVVASNKS